MYVKKNIPSKYLEVSIFQMTHRLLVILTEINLKQGKLLVVSIYRLPDQKLTYFFSSITDVPDHYLKTYEDFIVIGDFNKSESSAALESLLD